MAVCKRFLMVLSFSSMSCRECSKDVDDLFHDLCRGHSYCAKGPQYYGAPCVICEDLWERSRDLDKPYDAMLAFSALKRWIVGFRKNSRHRPAGLGHFFSMEEKEEYQELSAKHANLQDISSEDSPAVKPKVKRKDSYKYYIYILC